MQTLSKIALGWYSYSQATDETKYRMLRRLKVCDSCPNKQQYTGAGVLISKLTNDPKNLYKCGLCNCPLAVLASLPSPGCKAGKWNAIG